MAILKAAGLTPASGRTVSSKLRSGLVAYTSPRAGRSAPAGGKVYVYRSGGAAKATPAPKSSGPVAPKTLAPVPPSQQPPDAGATTTG